MVGMIGILFPCNVAAGRQEVAGIFWIIRGLAVRFAFTDFMDVEAIEARFHIFSIGLDLDALFSVDKFDLAEGFALTVGDFGGGQRCFFAVLTGRFVSSGFGLAIVFVHAAGIGAIIGTTG